MSHCSKKYFENDLDSFLKLTEEYSEHIINQYPDGEINLIIPGPDIKRRCLKKLFTKTDLREFIEKNLESYNKFILTNGRVIYASKRLKISKIVIAYYYSFANITIRNNQYMEYSFFLQKPDPSFLIKAYSNGTIIDTVDLVRYLKLEENLSKLSDDEKLLLEII